MIVPLTLVAVVGAACSDDAAPAGFETGFEAVEISGDFGSAPEISWNAQMEAGDPEVRVIEEGSGEELAAEDRVFVNFVLANGYTEESVLDSFAEDTPGVSFEVSRTPEQLNTVPDLIADFLSGQIEPGTTRGSRIAVTASATEVFGSAVSAQPIAQEGIGNKDGLLIVADIVEKAPLAEADGAQQKPPPWAPKVVFEKGVPTSIDFKGTEPSGKLRTAVLRKGDGEEVDKGDLLYVNYLGQVPGGKQPFDGSFTEDREPFSTPIGLGGVVKGWDRALVGQTVGSRVLLEIPPKLGYGDDDSNESIPPNSTLYFVIDILASS